ncbi:MAG: Nif3-like dinuclear metal center hexameric protein [Desulfobaccales bacterium]|nr:Nif3-like dinuclear metal center hexameric protein [Desulfobaccales bacterium]
MAVRLKEILKRLESQCPSAWAVAGDRVGLEVGHPETQVKKILVALEATPEVVAEAARRGAQLLLTHHPLLYQPVKEVREDQPSGRLLAAVIRAGLALVSCHTNLDVAPGGLNDYLAQILGLTEVEVLAETARDSWCKLAVMVPVGYEERLLKTLGDAGLGVIGRYSHCSFAVRGQGTYRPLEGARPFKGEVAKLSRAQEVRLEVLVPESRLEATVALVKEAHPYEEPAYDLYPVKNPGAALGLGRLGRWPKLKPFPQVVSLVKKLFGVKTVKVWGQPAEQVQRVAVCGGSGGDLIGAALSKGAQVYVTGEVRHHQVPAGGCKDFAVLEVGHFASEVVFMEPWAKQLQHLFSETQLAVQVEVAAEQTAPLGYL